MALALPALELPRLPLRPDYTPEDLQWIQNHHCPELDQHGWHRDPEGRLILPAKLGLFLLSNLHQATHLGKRKLLTVLESTRLKLPQQAVQIQEIVDRCVGCQAMRPSRKGPLHTGTRVWGRGPGRSWEVDFTEVKPGKYGYKYLLVFVDILSGWVEAFPTKRETAQVVAKALLEEIIPQYGVPEVLGSDNGPAFISKILKGLAQAVGTNWNLHCEYNPQSSGQVERMNWALKETLSKLAIETGGDWVTLLPCAIFWVRNSSYVHRLTLFEILYGRPPPIIVRALPDQDPNVTPNYLASLKALQKV